MNRRQLLRGACVAGGALLAGCIGGGGGTDGGNDGNGQDGNDDVVENYGLPSCENTDATVLVRNAELSVGEEEATVAVTYEFSEDAQEGSDAISVTFQVAFLDGEGNELRSVADSSYVATDKTIEREFSYSGMNWEEAAAFELNISPDACA